MKKNPVSPPFMPRHYGTVLDIHCDRLRRRTAPEGFGALIEALTATAELLDRRSSRPPRSSLC
jgi:hypothetical protein